MTSTPRPAGSRLACALALFLLGAHAPGLRALDLRQLREWQAGRQLAATGDLAGAQARWDAVLEEAPGGWAVVLARPCAGELVVALGARMELAPVWIAGPVDGCHGLLWGCFATEAEARVAAGKIPPRYLEGEPDVVPITPPLAQLDVRPPAVAAPGSPMAADETIRDPTREPAREPAGEPSREPIEEEAPQAPPVAVAPIPAPDLALSASELFQRGNEAYARGDQPTAIAYYEAAIQKDPANPRTHNNLGTARLVADQPALAERAFRQAVALDPSYARAWLNLGTAVYAQGRAEEARPMLEKAVALDPDNIDARSNLAALLVEMRHWSDARDVLEEALARFPDEPQLARQLEQVEDQLALREDPAAGEDAGEAADVGEPAETGAAAGRSSVFAASGLGPCATDVSRSRRIAQAGRLFEEGRSQFARSQYEAAEASFEKALECDPTSPAILNHLGAARLAAGRAGSAASAFSLALEQDPAFLEASINLALAAFEMGRCTDAVDQLKALTGRQDGAGEAWFQLGRMLYRCGRPGEATTALERARLLLPADARPAQLLDRLRAEQVRAP